MKQLFQISVHILTSVPARGVARILSWGGRFVPPSPTPSPPLPAPTPPQPLPLSLRSRPLKSSYGVWGSAVSSPPPLATPLVPAPWIIRWHGLLKKFAICVNLMRCHRFAALPLHCTHSNNICILKCPVISRVTSSV